MNNTKLISDEMKDYFIRRTNYHIDLVTNNMILMENYYGLNLNELKERGCLHDKSKFKEPENEGYIWLTWFHRCKNCNILFNYPNDEIKNQVYVAIEHHITNQINRHHPESVSHSNQNEMSTLDIVEMVCDWSAISQELNQGSCINYVQNNIKKWSFSQEKIDFIFETIKEFDRRYNNCKKL